MHMQCEKREKTSFTLIELITVITIMAVIMGLSAGIFSYASNKAAESSTRALITKLDTAINNYKANYGCFPNFPTAYYYNNWMTPTKGSNYSAAALAANLANVAYRLQFLYLNDTDTAAFNKLIDYENIKARNVLTYGSNYCVIDDYGNPILFRYPGYVNKMGFDLGSPGPDGAAAMDTSTSDDITNFIKK